MTLQRGRRTQLRHNQHAAPLMDHIQSTIATRAQQLGLSSYEIAKRCDGSPNKEAVRRYITDRCSLSSKYVAKICEVLGLELRPVKKRR